MLLSETLKEMVDNTNETDWEEVKKTCHEMIKLCFGKVEEDMKQDMSLENCVIAFQRVSNIWNLTVKYSEKVGKPFIKENGFKDLIKSKQEFKEIHHRL